MRISCYTSLHRYRQSVTNIANEFPQLNESNIRRKTSTYKSQFVQQQTEEKIIIGWKCGRLLYHKSHEIIDELILNLDQTLSTFVAACKVTMTEKGSKHVYFAGGTAKRCITLTVPKRMSGQLLPLQVIYKGKTYRCLPPKDRDDKRFFFLLWKTLEKQKRESGTNWWYLAAVYWQNKEGFKPSYRSEIFANLGCIYKSKHWCC